MIEFYTEGLEQYIVTPNEVYRGEELVGRGKTRILHLIMNECAWIEVDKGQEYPPLFLRLGKVVSVLPKDEIYRGKRVNRKAYQVSYFIRQKQGWVQEEEEITAFDEVQIRQILKAKHATELRGIKIAN